MQTGDKGEATSLFESMKGNHSIPSTKFVTSHGWFNSFKDLAFLKIILKENGNTASADIKAVEANLKHFNVYKM